MNVRSIMLIAGEASGDLLAAELIEAWRPHFRNQPFAPRFFGAGGARLEAAGVELAEEMTRHAVVGLGDVVRNLAWYRRLFYRLLELACARQPDVVVLIDFTGFNRRFARALRRRIHRASAAFGGWRPRIVQYVSPQVWASRPGRAYAMAKDVDLLLCLFPFEKRWYARRLPTFPVRCVGHPICDRYPEQWRQTASGAARETAGTLLPTDPAGPQPQRAPSGELLASPVTPLASRPPLLLLLPGSREAEVRRHLGPMLGAAERIAATLPIRVRVVAPGAHLAELAAQLALELAGSRESAADKSGARSLQLATRQGTRLEVEFRPGELANSLREAVVAIASTGTVTLECALFGLPTVALYKTSWSTYQVGRRVVTVDYLAMPNILAGREVFPEFIQDQATPENLARAALELLRDPERRTAVQTALRRVIRGLGGPGASQRAAAHLAAMLSASPQA